MDPPRLTAASKRNRTPPSGAGAQGWQRRRQAQGVQHRHRELHRLARHLNPLQPREHFHSLPRLPRGAEESPLRPPPPCARPPMHALRRTTKGDLFDSSIPRGEPISFPLDRVIAGWTEGLQLMTVGESRRFWIPAKLAYGDNPPPGAPGARRPLPRARAAQPSWPTAPRRPCRLLSPAPSARWRLTAPHRRRRHLLRWHARLRRGPALVQLEQVVSPSSVDRCGVGCIVGPPHRD